MQVHTVHGMQHYSTFRADSDYVEAWLSIIEVHLTVLQLPLVGQRRRHLLWLSCQRMLRVAAL